jgi:hypothetical protein
MNYCLLFKVQSSVWSAIQKIQELSGKWHYSRKNYHHIGKLKIITNGLELLWIFLRLFNFSTFSQQEKP